MEDLQLDSDDEKYVGWYFQELKEAGIVLSFRRCQPFTLNEPLIIEYEEVVKLVTKTKHLQKKNVFIEGKVYTPDYEVFWGNNTQKFVQDLYTQAKKNKVFVHQGFRRSIIEVKPIHDMHNMTRLFKHNQAIMWDRHKIYVNLVTYQELFEATFTPLRYIIEEGTYKKNSKHGNKGDNKIKWKVRTLQEYLEC